VQSVRADQPSAEGDPLASLEHLSFAQAIVAFELKQQRKVIEPLIPHWSPDSIRGLQMVVKPNGPVFELYSPLECTDEDRDWRWSDVFSDVVRSAGRMFLLKLVAPRNLRPDNPDADVDVEAYCAVEKEPWHRLAGFPFVQDAAQESGTSSHDATQDAAHNDTQKGSQDTVQHGLQDAAQDTVTEGLLDPAILRRLLDLTFDEACAVYS
jgi:hypothetical protein